MILRDAISLKPIEPFSWEDGMYIDRTKREETWKILSGEKDAGSTILATSNLRRAFLTGLIALYYRKEKGQSETVHILSCAQEISKGDDAQSITPVESVPEVDKGRYGERFDTNPFPNRGDQNGWTVKTGATRLVDFCRRLYLFYETGNRHMILTGHSSWLQKLIKKYLSEDGNNILEERLKTRGLKLGNASVVRFQMKLSDDGCEIVRGSTTLIFGYLQDKTQSPTD